MNIELETTNFELIIVSSFNLRTYLSGVLIKYVRYDIVDHRYHILVIYFIKHPTVRELNS